MGQGRYHTYEFHILQAGTGRGAEGSGIPQGDARGGSTICNTSRVAASPPIMMEMRQKAKARGLYNFFLPEVGKLSVLEYAPIAEILGAFPLCNIAMNCTAPDTGNMEVLEKFGTPEQKKMWLEPLLEGQIRSAYAMTEPGVAS